MKANLQNTLVVPESTRVSPYNDDFDESKNFKRILFRPGYPVQGRELTQLQTILQNQIERFGQHIFVNGSSVIGGEVRFMDSITLNLSSTYTGTDIDVNNFRDKIVTYGSGNNDVIAKVVQVTGETDTEPPTLYLGKNYITGSEFSPGDTIKVSGEEVFANIVDSANASSKGTLAFIDDSIFFYNGFFIKTPKQIIVVSKYDVKANAKVGLELEDGIITETSDSSLLDPALGASNYQAPGAGRYYADLILAKRELDSIDDEKFFEISRIENGVLRKNITVPVYSEIEEVLARRTYDESGNYTVKPFKIIPQASTEANNVQIVVSEGKGYILGYEFETIAPEIIEVPRALTTSNVFDYNLNMNYGNYVVVNGLGGEFDTKNMGLVDIHCVNYDTVNTVSSNSYNSTKIGTARVRDLEFYSGDVTTADRKYEFYLFDTKFQTLAGKADSTGAQPNLINLQKTFSSNTDNTAYVGATIVITSGTSSGDIRTINNYNKVTQTASVTRNFTATTDNTSYYEIKYDFGDAESFLVRTGFTPGSSANANATITVLNKTNGLANGDAYVTEQSLSTLVFDLPESYIKPGTMDEREYTYRRVYTGVQFTAGVSGAGAVQASSGEDFVGATSTSNTSTTVMDNFLVVISDPQSSGRPKGDQVKVTTTISGSPESVVFDSANGSDTFVATVYAKMQINTDSAAEPRVKTLVKANTLTFTSESAANTFINSSGSNTSVYLNTGQVVISNPSRRYDERESLFISDVTAVKKIYDLAGSAIPGAGADLTGYSDVTNNYIFDNGQRDSYYDHASIRLRPGATPSVGPLVVCCRYFNTTTDDGYFSVDSYPSLTTDITEEGTSIGSGYAIIPAYGEKQLRDCIDFRPVRRNAANTAAFTLGGTKIPTPVSDFKSSYDYYLGRRDLITLTGNRTFELVQGIPAKYPQNPKTPTRSMVLYALSVPPYTAFPSNVAVEFVENKRYTMRDIGLLDKRIENVEYYVKLNTLEKNAVDMDIRDVNGLSRSKYGIFVDSFTGHSLGDSELFDYKISVDFDGQWTGAGLASNEFAVKGKYIRPNQDQDNNIFYGSNKLMLSFTEEPAIYQNTATKFTAVADYLYATFEGNMITFPAMDIWKDISLVVIVNQINITNKMNLKRWITKPMDQEEQKLRNQGMSTMDVLNAWASDAYKNNLGGTNLSINNKQISRGLGGNQLLNQDALNRLNNVFG